jgi:hypothetical protein
MSAYRGSSDLRRRWREVRNVPKAVIQPMNMRGRLANDLFFVPDMYVYCDQLF